LKLALPKSSLLSKHDTGTYIHNCKEHVTFRQVWRLMLFPGKTTPPRVMRNMWDLILLPVRCCHFH